MELYQYVSKFMRVETIMDKSVFIFQILYSCKYNFLIYR